MSNNDIRNFINSSSLGVYTKYIRVVNGTKYLVKSGRGDGKSKTSILESEEIEDLLLDSDYAKCFDTSNRKQLNLVDYHSLNLNINYEIILNKYSKYLSKRRYDFILTLLK